MRHPRLELMRAQRQRLEDELAAPHRNRADLAVQSAREAREALAGLERIMRSKFAPEIIKSVAHEMGRGFYVEIMKAVASLGGATPTTTITVPTGMLLSADRDSIVSRVVDWWKSETVPRISFRAMKGPEEIKTGVTVMHVTIPELHYQHRVADGF